MAGMTAELPIQPIAIGEPVVVRHDWGHRDTATWIGVEKAHSGLMGVLRFGIAGMRTVCLKKAPKSKNKSLQVGRFTEKGMDRWFIDTGTVERMLESEGYVPPKRD